MNIFTNDSKVLLVGEGNFSFAVSVTASDGFCSPHQVVATCFESENSLPKIAMENCNILRNRGTVVLFEIDGRKLETYFETQFSHIVFNFPHCGGKMKIHNNRQLLKEFFVSAKKILHLYGFIIVTLCSGQGGIALDTERKWDDTWKVTEMAAHANLILSSVKVFDSNSYSGYNCCGYRSTQKGFYQNNSLTYIFCQSKYNYKSLDIKPLDTVPVNLIEGKSIEIPKYSYSLIKSTHEENSLCHSIIVYITDVLSNIFNNIVQKDLVLFSEKDPSKFFSQCSTENSNFDLCIYPSFHINLNNYIVTPCCSILVPVTSYDSLISVLLSTQTLNVHNISKSWKPIQKKFELMEFCLQVDMSYKQRPCQNAFSCIILDLEKLTNKVFNLGKKEIFGKGNSISEEKGFIIYQPLSFSPLLYTFHLSFLLPEIEDYQIISFHSKVYSIINNVAQDSLVNFYCLNNYYVPKIGFSETYAISYCSHNYALSKDMALSIHKTIGHELELYLSCKVR